MIESLKHHIANSLKQECPHFFLPVESHQYAQEILNAHLYPLCSQGKLIRPLFVLLVAGGISGESAIQMTLPAALAVECVNTYSLVHDDLPCMDDDNLRRGQPTTHVVYGEAKGLLVGDGLLTAAFEILASRISDPALAIKLIKILSKACGARGMIFGQWMDMSSLDGAAVSHTFYTIHTNKTGKLFGACFEMGFLCGLHLQNHHFTDADVQKMQNTMFQIGVDFGLSFQFIDDILDATQNAEALGKTPGKDAAQDKLSAVKLFGIQDAQKYANEYLSRAKHALKNLFEENFSHLNYQDNLYYKSLLELLNKLSTRQT